MITVSEDTAMPNLIRNLRLVAELTNIQIGYDLAGESANTVSTTRKSSLLLF